MTRARAVFSVLALTAAAIAHAQQPAAPGKSAPAPDTLRTGMSVRLHIRKATIAGTVIQLDSATLILQEIKGKDAVQTTVPLACLTGADKELPHTTPGHGAIVGGAIGAVVGAAVGVIANNQSSSGAAQPAAILLGWGGAGAVLGGATGALIVSRKNWWEPIGLPPHEGATPQQRRDLCKAWAPAED